MQGERHLPGVRDVAVLRIPTGASIPQTLLQWAEERGVQAASVSGIGAASDVELGYFHRDRREYSRRRVPGEVEIVSLAGNIALKEGRPFAHLHVVVTGEDCVAVGGHLFEARAATTCELVVTVFDGTLRRVHDEASGLYLLEW